MSTEIPTAKFLQEILTDPKHARVLRAVKDWSAKALERFEPYQLAGYATFERVKNNFTWSDPVKGYSILLWRDSGQTVELDVTGVITDVFFGPVRAQTKLSATSETSKQKVVLAAPGDPNFEAAVQAINTIYWYAEQQGRENELHSAAPTNNSITATARFLTNAQFNVFGNPIPKFRYPELDPEGRLQRYVDAKTFVYTADNIVECLEIDRDGINQKESRKPISPLQIRRGQAAEISISFATVKAGSGRSFIVKLNQVVVIDRLGSMLLEQMRRQHAHSVAVQVDAIPCIPSRKRKQVDEREENDGGKRICQGQDSQVSYGRERGHSEDGEIAGDTMDIEESR